MSNTITQAFVQEFDTSVRLKAQQTKSRLQSAVTDRGSITGESFTINNLAAYDKTPANTTRHGDTIWSDATHEARLVYMQDFYDAQPVDRADEPKVLASPMESQIMANLMAAWERRKDAVIYRALRDSITLKDAGTASLAAANKIAHGSTGMTKTKLIQARAYFRRGEADTHAGEELFIMYTADMVEDILADTTLTSADFMASQFLQAGDIVGKWMGFTWIPFEGIDPVSSSTYYTMAWAKSAIHFGQGFAEGRAQRRADKKDTLQLSMAASIGAGRAEEGKVLEIAYQ